MDSRRIAASEYQVPTREDALPFTRLRLTMYIKPPFFGGPVSSFGVVSRGQPFERSVRYPPKHVYMICTVHTLHKDELQTPEDQDSGIVCRISALLRKQGDRDNRARRRSIAVTRT